MPVLFVCQCDCVSLLFVCQCDCGSAIVCQCDCVFLTKDNDVKVPQVFAQNYEMHLTRETFHENFLQSPQGFTLFWDQFIYRDNRSCDPLHKRMEV